MKKLLFLIIFALAITSIYAKFNLVRAEGSLDNILDNEINLRCPTCGSNWTMSKSEYDEKQNQIIACPNCKRKTVTAYLAQVYNEKKRQDSLEGMAGTRGWR